MKKEKVVALVSGTLLVGAGAYLVSSVAAMSLADANAAALPFTLSTGMASATSQTSSSSTKKGLLFSSKTAGAKASFKTELSSVFTADLLPLSTDLAQYSLTFTESDSKQSFAIIVANHASGSDVSVSYNGERAGIVYYETSWNLAETMDGFSAAYNNAGTYCAIKSSEAQLMFDPVALQVSVIADNGDYKTVWDFSKTYNDGRRLQNNLTSFNNYTVDLSFDEMKPNAEGQLLAYSFGGFTLDKDNYDDVLSVRADVTMNAVVGKLYTAPQGKASSLSLGALDSSKISLAIYNSSKVLQNTDGAYSFTPAKKGLYYLNYTVKDGTSTETRSYRISALSDADVSTTFAYDQTLPLNSKIGVHDSLYIPSVKVQGSLSLATSPYDGFVSIKKDGSVLANYSAVAGGFTYSFESKGEYEILYTCPALGEVSESKFVSVREDVLGVVLSTPLSEMAVGSPFEVPSATLYLEGQEMTSEATLFYPSGLQASSNKITLTEAGIYRIMYRYVYKGNVRAISRSFAVHQSFASLWNGVSAKYGVVKENNEYSGTCLTLSEGAKAIYSKTIDVSDNVFDDSVADPDRYALNSPLLSLRCSPNAQGKNDMDAIYVVLTDASDSDNTITIRLRHVVWGEDALIRTKAKGQIWAGYNYDFWTAGLSVHADQSHEDGGFTSTLSFTQNDNSRPFARTGLSLYWDNARGSLFATPTQLYGHNSGGEDKTIVVPWLVRDYMAPSDDVRSAGDAPWKGFKSNEVQLTVYAVGVASTADVYVDNVDGVKTSEEFINDTSAPKIKVDLPSEGAPKALVGSPYSLFDFTASDSASDVVEKYALVYRGNELVSTGKSFTPDQAGVYTLVYYAKDAFGNLAHQEVSVQAYASIDKPTLEILGTLPTSAYVGERVGIPESKASGGAGAIKTEVKVSCDGTAIEVENGTFLLSQEGTYLVSYTATDYVGNSVSKYLKLENVIYNPNPVIAEDSIYLPKEFIHGDTYCFNDYLASYYSKEGHQNVHAEIKVSDGKGSFTLGEDRLYTPSSLGTVTSAHITFTFAIASGAKTVIERDVPIRTISQGRGFMSQYFVGDNATCTTSDEGASFTPTTSGETMNVSFLRPTAATNFSLSFAVNSLPSFSLSLTDEYDPSIKAALAFTSSSEGLYCSVNGGEKSRVNTENDVATIRYSATSHNLSDGFGVSFATLQKSFNGAAFNGFTSGNLYFDFSFASPAQGSSFVLKSIGNQAINSFKSDLTRPSLRVNGTCAGRYTKGENVTIHEAYASDILNAIGEVTVSISKDGKVLLDKHSAKESFVYTPSEMGSYEVTYLVSDAKGNKTTITQYFSVVDEVKPTLDFGKDNPFPSSVAVGTTLSLPSYTLVDNGDLSKASVRIYLIGQDGLMSVISDGKVTFEAAGTYSIEYFVMDENENVNVYSFMILVK